MRAARSALASAVVLCLYQHRLMSTSQLHRLLLPNAASSSYLRRELASLRAGGLVDAVASGRAGAALWFVTSAGADLAEQTGQVTVRPYRMTAERAAGMLQQHTLDVNEAGLAFAGEAMRRGDTCGPLSWMPEIAHLIRRGQYLICDALVDYVTEDEDAGARTQLQWFIELDRATMPVARLASKLALYGRYRRACGSGGLAAWRERYASFPRVLIVLSGAAGPVLDRRICDLTARVARDGALNRDGVTAGATTLARLTASGPFSQIFTKLGGAGGACCDARLT